MLKRKETVLVIVDVQERMMNAIPDQEKIVRNIERLAKGCIELNVPILVTEQYPQGLGATVESLREVLGEWYRPIEKTTFSAAEEMAFMRQFEAAGRQQVLVCGVEAHVCVYQTARDLRAVGWDVEVVADAVSSRSEYNCEIALGRLNRHGVESTSVEMALFDMMQSADIPEFKAVSTIVK